jgi:hypothetical protein
MPLELRSEPVSERLAVMAGRLSHHGRRLRTRLERAFDVRTAILVDMGKLDVRGRAGMKWQR